MKVTEKTKTLEKSMRELTMNLEMEKKQYTYVWRKCFVNSEVIPKLLSLRLFLKKKKSDS